MANPNIRTVTGKSTIPAGVSKAGIFTTHTTFTDRLVYSGTAAALNTILSQGRENSELIFADGAFSIAGQAQG